MTGEKEIFEQIAEEREHVSFLTGLPLHIPDSNHPYFVWRFAHVLPKGQYPRYRLKKENIILLEPDQHTLLDHGTEEKRERYAAEVWHKYGVKCDWDAIFDLKEQLRQQYEADLKRGQYMKETA